MERVKEARKILKEAKEELGDEDTIRVVSQAEKLLFIATSSKGKPVVNDKQYRILLKDRKIQSALDILGFSEYQKKCFLLMLSSKGLLTAQEISAYTGVPYQRVYDVMVSLEKYGIDMYGKKPKLYNASSYIINNLVIAGNELISNYENGIKTGVNQLKKFIKVE
jgi:hypothetical protein